MLIKIKIMNLRFSINFEEVVEDKDSLSVSGFSFLKIKIKYF